MWLSGQADFSGVCDVYPGLGRVGYGVDAGCSKSDGRECFPDSSAGYLVAGVAGLKRIDVVDGDDGDDGDDDDAYEADGDWKVSLALTCVLALRLAPDLPDEKKLDDSFVVGDDVVNVDEGRVDDDDDGECDIEGEEAEEAVEIVSELEFVPDEMDEGRWQISLGDILKL
ncbi:hypothetical protein BGZ76_004525 [Entomortierella beljakovae]|nr:hypothetical protein BGZ76_004525 [Entomortierella beljakovae]